MGLKRRYLFDGGVVIEDDGHFLRVDVPQGSVSLYTGIRRWKEPGSEVKARFSRDGSFYYLPDWAVPIHGFFLSVQVYATEDEAKAAAPDGIFGKGWARLQTAEGEPRWRVALHFSGWDVKTEPDLRTLRASVPEEELLARDFLALARGDWLRERDRLDECLKPACGLGYDEIVAKIGPWVPVDEVPTVDMRGAGDAAVPG